VQLLHGRLPSHLVFRARQLSQLAQSKASTLVAAEVGGVLMAGAPSPLPVVASSVRLLLVVVSILSLVVSAALFMKRGKTAECLLRCGFEYNILLYTKEYTKGMTE
jgi:hypothetical protein